MLLKKMPRTYRRRLSKGKKRSTVRYGHPGIKRGGVRTFAKGGLGAVWKSIGQLKSLINVEYKNVVTNIADNTAITGVAPNGALHTCLNGVAQGDAANQRNGDSIRMQSLSYRFITQYNGASASKLHLVKWAIVQKYDPDGAYPDRTKWFRDMTVFESTHNPTYPNYVRVLKWGNINLDEYHQSHNSQGLINIHPHIRYLGTSAAYSDISRNGLYFYIWSDQASNSPTITKAEFKFSYTDN